VAAVLSVMLWLGGAYGSLGESFHHAIFQTIANITTTGFAVDDFTVWPGFAPLLLVMLAFVGGSSSSTSGGMKVARVVMAVRQGLREVRQLVHPKGQFIVKMGGRRVSESIVLSVGGFCTLYVMSFLLLTLALAGTGLDLVTAFTAAAASINNLGSGLGEVSAGFSTLPPAALWICAFGMILGRLEVFTVLVLFAPSFWRE